MAHRLPPRRAGRAARVTHGQRCGVGTDAPRWRDLDRPLPFPTMPYVNVRVTRDGVTAEQKAQIVAEITDTLQRVLGKRPEHTHIIIDEVDPENWGYAGMLTTEYRRKGG